MIKKERAESADSAPCEKMLSIYSALQTDFTSV
jgi:hypothetical protein